MPIAYRPITADEYRTFQIVEGRAYTSRLDDKEGDRFRDLFELDRTTASFDGKAMVGTAASFPCELNVPGGRVPVGIISFVSTQPTHRRKGIVTEIIRRQLELIRDGGESCAVLTASESSIYARFGFGIASEWDTWSIDRTRSQLRLPAHPETSTGASIKFVDEKEARKHFGGIYDRAARERPGMLSRNEAYWDQRFWPSDMKRSFYVLCSGGGPEGGEDTGYAIYGLTGNDAGTIRVIEELCLAPGAHRTLWSFLLSLDMVNKIEAIMRPTDDPLPWMLENPRRLERKKRDGLWVRPLDVPSMLESRRYRAEGELNIRVIDTFCPWVDGVYRLTGGQDGATCAPTTDTEDIVMTAEDLGAIYLSGAKPSSLAAAGRVLERTSSSVATADAMFGWRVAPWCPAVEPIV